MDGKVLLGILFFAVFVFLSLPVQQIAEAVEAHSSSRRRRRQREISPKEATTYEYDVDTAA